MQEFDASLFSTARRRQEPGDCVLVPSRTSLGHYHQHNYNPATVNISETKERHSINLIAPSRCGQSSKHRHGIPLAGLVNLSGHSPTTPPSSFDLLVRSDSGNSSLSTNIDSVSNSSLSSSTTSSTFHSTSFDSNSFQEDLLDDFLQLKIYVPETQSEFDISCVRLESIARLKSVLIEHTSPGDLREGGFNHGLFSFTIGQFLDEQACLGDYYSVPPLDPARCKTYDHSSRRVINLEFLYKQRSSHGEIMSTLPLASSTKKKRKRSRLLTAIQNANIDKVAKALGSCDPNFVDDSSGETPLSLAASSQPATNVCQQQQQIIVAIVNGGALLDFRTKDGRTALHSAVQKSNFFALKTLLDLGASPNYADAHGLTPLYYTIIYKANPKLTQLLLHEHAAHGVVDEHGWQEVHHASKLGLVNHLEQLLFYGCDMNCRIAGSGNTALHVAALNDQLECVRLLLLRGCDTCIVNNSHQNAHQVAVIAGNLSLAELINSHRAESVVPYRDKPRFNPARRPQSHYGETKNNNNNNNSAKHTNGAQPGPRPLSPSMSHRTNNTSSGVCCDQDDKKTDQGVHDDDEDDLNEEEDEEDVTAGNDDQVKGNGSSSEDNSMAVGPGMTVRAVSDYNSGDPSHLQLRRNDLVLLLPSSHSPPTIASQKLLLGRRCFDGQEGFFPACCIERIKKSRNDEANSERVEGRRDMKFKNVQSATLPSRGRRGGRKCLLDKGVTRHYQERTVTLLRGSKGFGFVLRGAKDSSPILNKQLMQPGGSMPLIGLQYFDEIEDAGVADAAGLKRGDFLLAVNDVDVRQMSHENVVQLIRKSGDKVTMTIATPAPKQLVSILKKKGKSNKVSSDEMSSNGFAPAKGGSDTLSTSQSQNQMSQSVYASFGGQKQGSRAPPPAPPKRDPSTTLTTSSRARARSLVVSSEVKSAHSLRMVEMNINDDNHDLNQEQKIQTPKGTINRSRSLKTESSLDSIKPPTPIDPRTLNGDNQHDSESQELPPPPSPHEIHSSIIQVTAAKQTPADDANRSMSSLQVNENGKNDKGPHIPEPDYSSDEDEDKKNKENKDEGTSNAKYTTTATVVFKATSPIPPKSSNGAAGQEMFSKKNMFEELREQSAKITNAARLKMVTTRQGEGENIYDSSNKQEQPLSNVRKNVAEFERKLSFGSRKEMMGGSVCRSESIGGTDQQALKTSKSYIEEFGPNAAALKKEFSTLTRSNLKHQSSQQSNQDTRRNSAIISAIAEKVAAVNQLVAEQQQQSAGSKSLNSSPIPTQLTAASARTTPQSKLLAASGSVVVQKPIAMLPPASSATLNRRCVTVCEDPVKAIHLQQQHQQLRSQLAAANMINAQLARSKHTSLAESSTSILKQSAATVAATKRSVNLPDTTVVPPPPEFAVSGPIAKASVSLTSSQLASLMSVQQQQPTAKIYIQRPVQASSSPLTIQTSSAGGGGGLHHHHHHQLMSEVMPAYGQPQQQQQQHSHQFSQHSGHPVQSYTLSSSAPTNSDGLTFMRTSLMNAGVNSQVHQQQQQQQQSLYSTQQLTQAQQNQLILQQRAAALKYQQQQQIRAQTAAGHYNTLATSRPQAQAQQVQYYVTTNNQNQPQYFATLSRQQPTSAQAQQQQQQAQYLNSISQFSTLPRNHQQQLQAQLQPILQHNMTYAQFLAQQQQHRQAQQQGQSMALPAGTRLVQQVAANNNVNRQTPPLGQTKTAGAYQQSGGQPQQQQQQQQQYQYLSGGMAQGAVPSYARKSMVEWTVEDVQEWLQRIGMAEHRPKFESFNGAKMLRLDNTSLTSLGVRQQQHRIYLLEKLKQQIWQTHQ